MVGTLIPMFFKKINVDPAVASGPLITTVNDLVAIVVYYGLAMLFLVDLLHVTLISDEIKMRINIKKWAILRISGWSIFMQQEIPRNSLLHKKAHSFLFRGLPINYGNDNFFQLDVLAYDPLELKMML